MSQQINLYNPIFLKQEKHFSARTMLQATGVVLLGAAGVCAYAWYQVASIEGLAEDSRNSLKVQRDQLVKLGAQVASKGHSRAIELEIERTRVQVNDRRALLASLQGGAQGGTEGFSRYLAAFARQTSRGVWLTGLSMSGNGQDLNVSGRALHADMLPGYLDALGKEDVMRGRQVIELKLSAHVQDAGKAPVQQGPARYVEFSLSAPMRKGAEAFAMPAGKAASKGGLVKRILMQYAERIDAASLRERVGIFTAVLFVMLFIVDSAILAPLLDKERKLTRENAQRQAEALVIQQQVKALVRARDDNPDERNRRVLAELKLESGRLESSILEQSRRFTPPERMRSVLQEMLERNSKLQLVEFKTLAVAPLAESGGDKARAPERRIFRHGVELTLSGSYLDLHAYLTALEKLPTQLYWGKADLGASAYPTATLKLTVFTLSLDPAWMVV